MSCPVELDCLFLVKGSGEKIMFIISVVCRHRRRLSALGVFCCLLLLAGGAFAQTTALPEDAPILISEANSTRALFTVSNGKRGAGLPTKIVQPGRQTIVTFFVTNLVDLLAGEGANAFRAEFEDAQHYRYPLEIVRFERTPERKQVYALSIRVGDGIGNVGDVLARVTWRGMSSN